MPFIDMNEPEGNYIRRLEGNYFDNDPAGDGVAMVQTVHQNFEGFTPRQVKEAVFACKAQRMMGIGLIRI